MSNTETTANFPTKDMYLISYSLVRARDIANNMGPVVDDINIAHVKTYLDFVSNIVTYNPSIRNYINTVMTEEKTDDVFKNIKKAIIMVVGDSHGHFVDMDGCVKHIDKALKTICKIYNIYVQTLKDRYQLANECEMTMGHVIMHLESTVHDMTQKDGLTPVPDYVEVDQPLHDIQTSLSILRAMKELS